MTTESTKSKLLFKEHRFAKAFPSTSEFLTTQKRSIRGFDRPSLLKPGKASKYDVDLWFTSRLISVGHRLRVTLASAAFPKYDRNLNTGGDNERGTRYVVVRQRILHDRAHPSFVRLPIIPR